MSLLVGDVEIPSSSESSSVITQLLLPGSVLGLVKLYDRVDIIATETKTKSNYSFFTNRNNHIFGG